MDLEDLLDGSIVEDVGAGQVDDGKAAGGARRGSAVARGAQSRQLPPKAYRMFFARHKRKLSLAESLLGPEERRKAGRRNAAQCWLEAHFDEAVGAWRYGCFVCRAATSSSSPTSRSSSFGRSTLSSLRIDKALRHQTSSAHVENVRRHLSLANEVSLAGSPPAEAFSRVWQLVREGVAVERGCAGIGSAKKLSQMRWCIAEAIRSLDRDFLRDAVCISISRDERDARLSIRYSATDGKLNTRRRTLGQARDFGSGAAAITAATGSIVKLLATPGHGAPPRGHGLGQGTAAVADEDLAHRILHRIEGLAVDAASDEVLSGELMRGGLRRSAEQAITPNLRFLLRDKTHGARRWGFKRLGWLANWLCSAKLTCGTLWV